MPILRTALHTAMAMRARRSPKGKLLMTAAARSALIRNGAFVGSQHRLRHRLRHRLQVRSPLAIRQTDPIQPIVIVRPFLERRNGFASVWLVLRQIIFNILDQVVPRVVIKSDIIMAAIAAFAMFRLVLMAVLQIIRPVNVRRQHRLRRSASDIMRAARTPKANNAVIAPLTDVTRRTMPVNLKTAPVRPGAGTTLSAWSGVQAITYGTATRQCTSALWLRQS